MLDAFKADGAASSVRRYRLKLATWTVVREPGQPSPRLLDRVSTRAIDITAGRKQRPRMAQCNVVLNTDECQVMTAARCHACGTAACPACSKRIDWRERPRVRVCNDCQRKRQPDTKEMT